ncbi:unnamed protein product [Bathycoccus prasinos]
MPSSSSVSSSSPRGFQAARERLNLQKQNDQKGNGGMDVFLKRTDAGRYLSSLFFEKDDNTKWILKVAGVLFLCVMCVFALAVFEHVFRGGGGGGGVVEAKLPVLSEREEKEEEEEEEIEEEKTTTKTLSVESIQNMTEDELRILELSVKMRDVLSKEKSNALREVRLSVERKQLEAKLAGLDLKKESNETMKTTNDMKRESLEFKMKLNREKVFREDVADALRTGLVVVCGALVYFGWNVIRDAWLNESEICYSSSSSSSSSFSLIPSNLAFFFATFINRLEKLWCVSKTFAKAAITSVASLYCSKIVVKFGLLSGTNSTVSPLSSIALTLGVGGGYLGRKFVRYLRGDETSFLALWTTYVAIVFLANESADRLGREILQSTLRRVLFRFIVGFLVPIIVASVPFREAFFV